MHMTPPFQNHSSGTESIALRNNNRMRRNGKRMDKKGTIVKAMARVPNPGRRLGNAEPNNFKCERQGS